HGRTTFEGLGGSRFFPKFATTRLFDGADNLTGIGAPFANAPELCAGPNADGSPRSPLCTALSYDRANRLIGVDEHPTTSSATRSCLGYDAQGNVSSVRSGCLATSTPGDCTGCSQPAATYQHDDFGNVITTTSPWTGTGSGQTRYEYDARGSLL